MHRMATFRRECRGLLRVVWQASGVPAGSSIRGEPPWDKAGCSGDSPAGVLAGLGTWSPCICRRFFLFEFLVSFPPSFHLGCNPILPRPSFLSSLCLTGRGVHPGSGPTLVVDLSQRPEAGPVVQVQPEDLPCGRGALWPPSRAAPWPGWRQGEPSTGIS